MRFATAVFISSIFFIIAEAKFHNDLVDENDVTNSTNSQEEEKTEVEVEESTAFNETHIRPIFEINITEIIVSATCNNCSSETSGSDGLYFNKGIICMAFVTFLGLLPTGYFQIIL